MRTVGLVLIIFALAAGQILIGGARLLYSIPVVALFAVAALLILWPERRSGKTARTGCVLAALAMAATILARIEWSPIEYLARPDQFIILGSILVYLLTALYFDQPRERLVVLIACFFSASSTPSSGPFSFVRPINSCHSPGFSPRKSYGGRADFTFRRTISQA